MFFTITNINTMPVESAPITQALNEAFAFLTSAQRYGLLQVRGGRASTELRQHMDEMSWPHPTRDDWRVLRINGFIRRRSDNLLHDLLPKGLTAATAITRDLCRKFNVHVLTVHERRPGVARYGSCSCGLMSHTELSRSNGTVEVAYVFHLQRMKADPGGYGSEARMNAIFDQVAAAGAEARTQFRSPTSRATPPGAPHLLVTAGAAVPTAAPVSFTEAR